MARMTCRFNRGYGKGDNTMKRKIIKERLERARWHFFAFTKIGWWLAGFTYRLYEKHPNKFTARLSGFCLPF